MFCKKRPESVFSVLSDSTETHDGWLLAFSSFFSFASLRCVAAVADTI